MKLTAVVLTFFAFATTIAAKPFKASHDGIVTLGNPISTYDAAGKATHMGKITETGSFQFAQPDPYPCSETEAFVMGEATMTRANGDSVSFTVEECVLLSEAGFTSNGKFTFTGGTGKFTDASGSGTFTTTGLLSGIDYDIHTDYVGTIEY